jgi:hypothetical protein
MYKHVWQLLQVTTRFITTIQLYNNPERNKTEQLYCQHKTPTVNNITCSCTSCSHHLTLITQENCQNEFTSTWNETSATLRQTTYLYINALYQGMAVTSLRRHALSLQCTPVCDLGRGHREDSVSPPLVSTWLSSCTRNSTAHSAQNHCDNGGCLHTRFNSALKQQWHLAYNKIRQYEFSDHLI